MVGLLNEDFLASRSCISKLPQFIERACELQ